MESIPDLMSEVKWTADDHHGSGSFSDVYRGDWNGQSVAVKKLRIFSSPTEQQRKVPKRLKRELSILCKLDHRNIVKLLGKIHSEKYPIGSMVFQWMDGGCLSHFLLKRNRGFSLKQRLIILCDIAEGLNYLHAQDKPIVHGDISAANILFDHNGVAHVSDFGMASIPGHRTTYQTTTVPGNLRWSAWEYYAYDWKGPWTVSREGDIYSFGLITLTVLSGKIPYHYFKDRDLIKNVAIDGKWPKRGEGIVEQHWALIKCCLLKVPAERPNIQLVVKELQEFCKLETEDEKLGSFPDPSPSHSETTSG